MIAIKTITIIFFFLPSFIRARFSTDLKIQLKIISNLEQLKILSIESIRYQTFSIVLLVFIYFSIFPLLQTTNPELLYILIEFKKAIFEAYQAFIGNDLKQSTFILAFIYFIAAVVSSFGCLLEGLNNKHFFKKDSSKFCEKYIEKCEKIGAILDAYIFKSIIKTGEEVCLIRLNDGTFYIGSFYSESLSIDIDTFFYKSLNASYVNFMPLYKGKFEKDLSFIKSKDMLSLFEPNNDLLTVMIKKEEIVALYDIKHQEHLDKMLKSSVENKLTPSK